MDRLAASFLADHFRNHPTSPRRLLGFRTKPATSPSPMASYQKYGYGSAGFFEVVQGLHPRGIPKSEARGGAGVAVKKVKKYLAKMDRAVDYDFYDDDDLRYVRFKSPFDRRPLIGRRPHPGKNAGKRTLRLVGSSSPDYMRQCEEAAFGDFNDWEDEVYKGRKHTNRISK